ncbi:MAG TPA: cytochrome c peroxidase [Geminicoccus sp.]|jgi:cytochrome c peroxidase|uniref:cytochrome-c peroxidase n=1 Tax=Geminicoccus sp. TaxID=2024832 RepID=UPI002E2FC5A4|nr:cytochrome c peroxidase [Geminicoccus sp.]HEX2525354.1 cytochrome c peroxidase [Geminicoccus sp.]
MSTKPYTRSLILASVAAAPVIFGPAGADALEPIESLGKNIFFDEKLSIPANKQACASCHDPARGWILPNATINATTVVAPGAKPHAVGNIKPHANAYASFSPPFRRGSFGPFTAPWEGGNFWDGRAEGCGATPGADCPTAEPRGAVSATIRSSGLPSSLQARYAKYLGPIADQALNPFPNDVEQNIREKNVCQQVKTAKYKDLYRQAYGGDIDCSPNPKANPACRTSFKRLAVALAAWQASSDVNSFSSRRDKKLADDPDHAFPLVGFTDQENLGHDLFYGIDSELNRGGKDARCTACHNGVPRGEPADPKGEAPKQLYTDNRFHHIGVPFNRQIQGVAKGAKTGLRAHVTDVQAGSFRTPTLRNVAKGLSASFKKAYTHNGWFKSLESLVHFYNTRDVLRSCESLGITQATEKEALQNNCWPAPEFPNPAVFVVGNLGLTASEEAAIVAYMKTLSDERTPKKP